MDVGRWLRGLGLEKYEAAFLDNGVGEAVLPHLTVEDLKEIGVAAVGDRRMLLAAIAALASSTASQPPDAQPLAAPPTKVSELSAERRPITVMFCDLVGSTSLAAKLDAEDWRDLVNAYLDEASKAVIALGGHVLKRLGDGVMALFGYPQAQENDAERAVRAALAIQRALADINAGNAAKSAPELSARIGIEFGPVVVEAAGEVFGDAPNIAARVETAAEPGTVLITASVQRQVAGLFVVEDKGAQELKGLATPVTLYRVVRASGGRRRTGARVLTPFIGREDDLNVLARRWERARSGTGQFVLVVGEPGLGKSRLIEEFHVRLGETPHTWVEWSSSQLLQNTPLHPLAEWGRIRFGGADVAPERRLADLESTLAQVKLDVQETATLLAPLLDIPLPLGRNPNLPPEELRRRQLAAMVALLLAGAKTQPVVLAFEDLHWADPTSLDLMRALAERGEQAPLFVVASARPEFRPPWTMRSHHGVIALAPLDRAQVARMVGEIAAQHALPQNLVDRVSERTGGVPLFVEEITRLLLERGEQGGVQAIPPTLQQSLAARLDRLGPSREVAQIGAVLGRNFTYSLLRDVRDLDESSLRASLERLAEADLLFVEGAPPQANYRFKHALIQDAAYESLLKSRRQPLHQRAAEVLREGGAEPETIAHHFTEAGLDDLAVEWWGKAGDQALRRSAFQEAIAHLGKAIAMADKSAGAKPAGASGERPQLHVAYGNALFAARGIGAPETTEAFARARSAALGDKAAPERLAADYGLWAGSFARGELPAMRKLSAACLSDVEARPNSTEAGVAHRVLGTTHWCAGEYAEARDHLERALALFKPGQDDSLAFRFGHDAGVAAMQFLAFTLWPLGDAGRAVSLVGDADARVTGLDHVGTCAFTRMHAAMFGLMLGDLSGVAQNAVQLASLTREHDLPMWRAYAVFLDGLAKSQSGGPRDGLEDMRRGAQLVPEQHLAFDGLVKIALAEAEARAGDIDRALVILDDALATSEQIGYHSFDAELHRVRGGTLLRRDPANPASAEKALQTSIVVAQRQGARSFQLRAALALAKLYQSTGRPVDAYATIAPAIEGFSPTAQMSEFVEGQALLSALVNDDEVKADASQRLRMTHLHVAYGNALLAARGWGAKETTEAFARARESASGDRNASERLAADFGLWVGSYVRGELRSMRAHAATFLRDVEVSPDSPEAGVAHRAAGVTCSFAGEYLEARDHFERALTLFQPGRDDDLAFRFGPDPGVAVMANLATASWCLGEVDRATSLMESMQTRMANLTHVGTLGYGRLQGASFELMRGDPARAASNALELVRLAQGYDLKALGAFGVFLKGWAASWSGAPADGIQDMRRGVELLREQHVLWFDALLKIALAEAEARAGDFDRAIALLDEALETSDRTGYRAFEAELRRARAEILLKRRPDNPAPAEEALLRAIAVAKQQGTRSFELRAALALAKLYRATGRPVDAQAVLAPTLDGFSPTPEMPEIAEAQALLASLAESDAVKAEAARHKRLTQLHVVQANALFAARGSGATETMEAFGRARDSASGDKDAPERLAADWGLWAGSYVRGELPSMRAHSAAFLRDVEARPDSPEVGVAHRAAGITCWLAGEYREARDHLERALTLFQPGRNDDLAFRFGWDLGVAAMANLATVSRPLGEVDRAVSLNDRMQTRIADLTHVGTLAPGRMHAALFELMRGDRTRAAPNALELARLAREHDLPMYSAFGVFLQGWATAASGAPADGLEDMRRGVELLREQSVLWFDGLLKIALAEAEARAGDPDRAIAILDEALVTSDRAGYRSFEAELHRTRGEMLLKRDPANPATAEDAFLAAIAVAKRQGTRTFELRAALALAKLYQSTARPADGHAVLAPALEGFAPTPEMPEIAEAQALIERSA